MQRNILKLYSFLSTHAGEAALINAWKTGDSFSLTLLPHSTQPALVSIRDTYSLQGFTHVYLTDPRTGSRALIELEESNAKTDAPAEAASRGEPRSGPLGENRQGFRRKADRELRLDRPSEAVDEDRQLYEASLTILAAMMAAAPRVDTPIGDMVDDAIIAAAALLHRIYEND
jgi:hypothetical protein